MRTGAWRTIAAAAFGCAGLAGAGPAAADYFGAPSVAAAAVDDDNLFFAPADPQPDRILRVTPAFEGGYRSAPLSWTALLSVDAERYERHPELDSDHAREAAALDYRHRTAPRLTLAANASYARTQNPGELAPESGLEFERRQAERFALAPSLALQLDRRTSAFAGYAFTRDSLVRAPGSETHELSLGSGRRTSRRDTASLEYRYRHFAAAAEERPSHAVLGGVTRRFSERTTGSLVAGPRFTDGSADLEAAASLRRVLLGGEVSLGYVRTETTVPGLADTATSEWLGASAGATAGPVEWSVASGVSSTGSGGSEADALTLDLSLGLRLTRLASVFGAYSRREQHGRLDIGDADRVERNVLMLGIVIREPARDEDDESRPQRARADRPWDAEGTAQPEEEEEP